MPPEETYGPAARRFVVTLERSVFYRRLAQDPVPLWGAVLQKGGVPPKHMEHGPVHDIIRHEHAVAFRGVSLNRLPTILTAGVDVTPTDAPIYVNFFEKAWEYGRLPKVMMAFTWQGLEQTFRTLPLDAPVERVEALRRTYPYVYRHDGRLWLSRIDDDNPARRHYEQASARWIPGDPFQSLKAVFAYGSAEDIEWAASCAVQAGT